MRPSSARGVTNIPGKRPLANMEYLPDLLEDRTRHNEDVKGVRFVSKFNDIKVCSILVLISFLISENTTE